MPDQSNKNEEPFRISKPLPIASKVVKSAVRTLQVLEFFDDRQCEMTLTEISSQLKYPQSSTSELLQSMTALGYLEFDREHRTYRPTIRVSLLGRWIDPEFRASGPILTLLEKLSELSEQTIVLAVRNGLYSQYIHVIQPIADSNFHMVLGSVRPLVRSGTGYALLAAMPDDEVLRILMRSNAESILSDGLVDQRDLFDRINKARDAGYALSSGLVRRGSAIIASALPQMEGQQQLAVGIGGSSDYLVENESSLLAMLKKCIGEHSFS